MRLPDVVLRRMLVALRGQANEAAVAEFGQIVGQALGWSAERRMAEEAATLHLLRTRHGLAAQAQPLNATHPVSAVS